MRSTYAGLRVLPASGETLDARRETAFVIGRGGMLTVAGGKLTTYRRIALDALDRLGRARLAAVRPRPLPLPGARGLGGASVRVARRFPELDPVTRSHVLHLYGSLAEEMLAPALARASLLEPIHPDAPDVLAQIGYAASTSGRPGRGRRLAADDARLPRSCRCGRRDGGGGSRLARAALGSA